MQTDQHVGCMRPPTEPVLTFAKKPKRPEHHIAISQSLLARHNILAQASNGHDAVHSFAQPILQQVQVESQTPTVLILCPNRALACDIARYLRLAGESRSGMFICVTTDGDQARRQRSALAKGGQIIIGTPKRVHRLMAEGLICGKQLQMAIIIETDVMLAEDYTESLQEILQRVPTNCQKALFTAGFSPAIEAFSASVQGEALRLKMPGSKPSASPYQQRLIETSVATKPSALLRILEALPLVPTIIFVNQRATIGALAAQLAAAGHSNTYLSGELDYSERVANLQLFRRQEVDIMLATGTHVGNLALPQARLVINFDLPPTTEAYLDRCNHLTVAGKYGLVISLATETQQGLVGALELRLERQLPRLPLSELEPKSLSTLMPTAGTKLVDQVTSRSTITGRRFIVNKV